MLDARIRPVMNPLLAFLASGLVRAGIGANTVTVAGFALGMLGLPAIWSGHFFLALGFITFNRLCDGLDGAIARHNGATNLGGYLDIVLDFIFYSAIVFGFALNQPEAAVAAAFLIFSFVGTGSSFLAFAIFAERLDLSTEHQGSKSFYYLGGIAEGFETITVLVLMCLFPEHFFLLAVIFGVVCWASTVGRILSTVQVLGKG